ncbi:3'-5' exonuclease [Oxalicibacterium flavum]
MTRASEDTAMHPAERLLFVDLETTGANAFNDRITEIGIVTVEPDGRIDRWSSLVNPGVPISSFIRQLTGIDNAMVADAPAFGDLAHELDARLSQGLFIAHNARFDYGFLHHAFVRTGRALHAEALCTVKLSRRLYPQEKKHSLDTLIARHALVPAARHRALADADLLWQFWCRLQAVMPAATLADAVTALRHLPKIQMPEIATVETHTVASAAA